MLSSQKDSLQCRRLLDQTCSLWDAAVYRQHQHRGEEADNDCDGASHSKVQLDRQHPESWENSCTAGPASKMSNRSEVFSLF